MALQQLLVQLPHLQANYSNITQMMKSAHGVGYVALCASSRASSTSWWQRRRQAEGQGPGAFHRCRCPTWRCTLRGSSSNSSASVASCFRKVAGTGASCPSTWEHAPAYQYRHPPHHCSIRHNKEHAASGKMPVKAN